MQNSNQHYQQREFVKDAEKENIQSIRNVLPGMLHATNVVRKDIMQ